MNGMTVAELIAELGKYDPDATVKAFHFSDDGEHNVYEDVTAVSFEDQWVELGLAEDHELSV